MVINKKQLRSLIEGVINEWGEDVYNAPASATRQSSYAHGGSISWASDFVPLFTDIIASFIPGVGQVIDVKDLALAIEGVIKSKGDSSKIDVAVSMIGFIPVVGDVAKAANRMSKTAKTGSKIYGVGGKISKSEMQEIKKDAMLAAIAIKKKYPKKFM